MEDATSFFASSPNCSGPVGGVFARLRPGWMCEEGGTNPVSSGLAVPGASAANDCAHAAWMAGAAHFWTSATEPGVVECRISTAAGAQRTCTPTRDGVLPTIVLGDGAVLRAYYLGTGEITYPDRHCDDAEKGSTSATFLKLSNHPMRGGLSNWMDMSGVGGSRPSCDVGAGASYGKLRPGWVCAGYGDGTYDAEHLYLELVEDTSPYATLTVDDCIRKANGMGFALVVVYGNEPDGSSAHFGCAAFRVSAADCSLEYKGEVEAPYLSYFQFAALVEAQYPTPMPPPPPSPPPPFPPPPSVQACDQHGYLTWKQHYADAEGDGGVWWTSASVSTDCSASNWERGRGANCLWYGAGGVPLLSAWYLGKASTDGLEAVPGYSHFYSIDDCAAKAEVGCDGGRCNHFIIHALDGTFNNPQATSVLIDLGYRVYTCLLFPAVEGRVCDWDDADLQPANRDTLLTYHTVTSPPPSPPPPPPLPPGFCPLGFDANLCGQWCYLGGGPSSNPQWDSYWSTSEDTCEGYLAPVQMKCSSWSTPSSVSAYGRSVLAPSATQYLRRFSATQPCTASLGTFSSSTPYCPFENVEWCLQECANDASCKWALVQSEVRSSRYVWFCYFASGDFDSLCSSSSDTGTGWLFQIIPPSPPPPFPPGASGITLPAAVQFGWSLSASGDSCTTFCSAQGWMCVRQSISQSQSPDCGVPQSHQYGSGDVQSERPKHCGVWDQLATMSVDCPQGQWLEDIGVLGVAEDLSACYYTQSTQCNAAMEGVHQLCFCV